MQTESVKYRSHLFADELPEKATWDDLMEKSVSIRLLKLG